MISYVEETMNFTSPRVCYFSRHNLTITNRYFIHYYVLFTASTRGESRVKRQDEDAGGDDATPEQLCEGRPADEYFRLTTEGDCRDVVR